MLRAIVGANPSDKGALHVYAWLTPPLFQKAAGLVRKGNPKEQNVNSSKK